MNASEFYEIQDALANVKTLDDVKKICEKLTIKLGFDHFVYGALFPTSLSHPLNLLIDGYPEGWMEEYMRNKSFHIDPVVVHCLKCSTPVLWSETEAYQQKNRTAHDFMTKAREAGLISGVSFPIHTPSAETAVFSLASTSDHKEMDPLFRTIMPHVHLFALYLHEAVREFAVNTIHELKRIDLTEREKECLLWAAEGKTSWETSLILNISERTVTFHLQNATKKLRAANRQHAVVRAIWLGLVNLY